MERLHRSHAAAAMVDTHRQDLAFAEQWRAGDGIADMRLQPAHHVTAIRGACQPTVAVNQAGIEQFDQRGEMRVIAVMRRRGEEQKTVGTAGHDLGQATAQRVVAVRAGGGGDAVMRLVDDGEVPGGTFQVLQHAFLLGEIERDQAQRDAVERVAAKLGPAAFALQCGGVGDHGEAQAEAVAQFVFPLRQQRARGRHHEDAMGAAAGDQFGRDEPGLDGLAQPHRIRQQQARTRQFQRAHQRDKLVRFDGDPARLRGQHLVRTGHLVEQAGNVMQAPGAQWPGRLRPQRRVQGSPPAHSDTGCPIPGPAGHRRRTAAAGAAGRRVAASPPRPRRDRARRPCCLPRIACTFRQRAATGPRRSKLRQNAE